MSQRLIFVRHALPNKEGSALSPEGRNIQKQATVKMEKAGIKPDIIYTSPLNRAIETAEIIGDHFNVPVLLEPALGESFDETALYHHIKETWKTILFVGHAPTLAEFVNTLTQKEVIDGLSKSQAVILDASKEEITFKFLINP